MVDWELVKKLIQMTKEEEISGLAIEEGGVKYEVRRDMVVAQAVPVASASAPVSLAEPKVMEHEGKKEKKEEEDGLAAIISPMVGTFYRSPSPEAPPFVENGDEVEPGRVVCIIEAMKLFNEIESEIRGKIVKILVDNGQPVEYGQKLMLVKKG
jgi:acetyl-CoA carboxylase biotin carboxyl carrier protein